MHLLHLWGNAIMPQVVAKAGSVLAVNDLRTIIANLRTLILGLFTGIGALIAAIGGLRLLLAGGDPGQVQAAWRMIRTGAIGFALGFLGPFLVGLLAWIGGG